MKEKIDLLKPVTIRFKPEAYSVISELAELNGKTKAEIIRISLDNRLNAYCKKNICLNCNNEIEIQKLIYDILTEISGIRSEIVRIKNNYVLQGSISQNEIEKFTAVVRRFEIASEQSGKIISRIRG